MKNRFANYLNKIPVNQHYSDYSLSNFAKNSGYKLISVIMRRITKEFGNESGLTPIKTIEATIILCRLSDGLISYLKVLPRYHINDEILSTIPDECDNIDIRFSLRIDRKGYYTPTWISCWKKGNSFTPNGNRIDWDILENKASQWTHQSNHQWIIPNFDFEKAIANQEESHKAAQKMLNVWFDSGSYRLDNTFFF